MDKRYQVFVSSTYIDLIPEREAVLKVLLEMDCIPAGMELFPASDDKQWTLIKKVIDDSDYYLLIMAGKYGSIGGHGMSYTRMEYEYALKTKKPIIAFLYANPDNLPASKIERDPTVNKKLEDFKSLVKKKVCKFWSSPADLSVEVTKSIIHLIKNKPARGWIKADLSSTSELDHYNIVPTKIFAPTQSMNLQFNEDLTCEIERAGVYIFRGVSGKRTAIRVKHRKNNQKDIALTMLIPHPFNQQFFLNEKINHRLKAKKSFGAYEEEKSRMANDIHMSLAALFSVKDYCRSISIYFQNSPSITRYEILDNAIYVNAYDNNLKERLYSPPIIKYASNSIYYDFFKQEVQREIDFATVKKEAFIISKNTSFEDLQNFFIEFGFLELTKRDYRRYLLEFETFEKKFLSEAKMI